jgi:chromosomal replication initiation ATPase DnaA
MARTPRIEFAGSFVENVSTKIDEKSIEPGAPRVGFDRIIEAVAAEFKVSREALTGSGRREDWVAGRRMLVYLGRKLGRDDDGGHRRAIAA